MIFGIALVVGAAYVMRPRPPSLLARSREIASVAPAQESPRFRGGWTCPFFWLSNTRILVIRETETAILGDRVTGSDGPREGMIVDTETGRETELAGFDARIRDIQKPFGKAAILPRTVSPDRRFILWTTRPNMPGQESVIITTLDGRHVKSWPPTDTAVPSYYDWSADSRNWLRLELNRGGSWLRRVTTIALSESNAASTVTMTRNFVKGTGLGTDRNGSYVFCNIGAGAPLQSADIGIIDINRPELAPKLTNILAPDSKSIYTVAFSSSTDRLAWWVYHERSREPDAPERTSNILFGRPPYIELWVSKLDGSGMRNIGVIDATRYSPPAPIEAQSKWSPDGKRIAFTYKQHLYLVRVD